MDIKQCKYCHKNFQGFSALCPVCAEAMDKKYLAVRNYLDGNLDGSMKQIAASTGVEEKSILFLIREGRLMLKGQSSDIKCMKCGAAVASGRYCDTCKASIVHSLEVTRQDMVYANTPNAAKTQRPATLLSDSSRDSKDSKVNLHTRADK